MAKNVEILTQGKKLAKFLLIGILVASCAKELPEKSNDNIDQNVNPISLFNGSVEIETTGTTESFAIEALGTASNMLALNESTLKECKSSKGDSKLAKFLKIYKSKLKMSVRNIK